MKISTLHNFIEILKIFFKQKHNRDYILYPKFKVKLILKEFDICYENKS